MSTVAEWSSLVFYWVWHMVSACKTVASGFRLFYAYDFCELSETLYVEDMIVWLSLDMFYVTAK